MVKKNVWLFENLLNRIDKRISFLGMNPSNVVSEKKKFFKNRDYNPVFRYARPSLAPDKLIRKAEDVELEENIINNLYMQTLEKFKKTNAMLHNLGKEEFTFFSKEIFGVPDKRLLNLAYKILKQEPVKETDGIDSNRVADVMKKVLAHFNLTDWVVGLKKMPANAAVLISRKKVFVRQNSSFPETFLKRVIVHEIGTHVFRAANGEKQPYQIFRTGLPNYLMTEEGMAVNAEELNDCLKINTLRAYAGRVLAVHFSLRTSFREAFEELNKYFDERLAWKIVLRAKRGLIDTSYPGAYTKDHLYLKGYYEVKKFLEKRGEQGLNTLYYGRIGLEHVPLMKKVKDLKEPELTPVSDDFRKMLKDIIS